MPDVRRPGPRHDWVHRSQLQHPAVCVGRRRVVIAAQMPPPLPGPGRASRHMARPALPAPRLPPQPLPGLHGSAPRPPASLQPTWSLLSWSATVATPPAASCSWRRRSACRPTTPPAPTSRPRVRRSCRCGQLRLLAAHACMHVCMSACVCTLIGRLSTPAAAPPPASAPHPQATATSLLHTHIPLLPHRAQPFSQPCPDPPSPTCSLASLTGLVFVGIGRLTPIPCTPPLTRIPFPAPLPSLPHPTTQATTRRASTTRCRRATRCPPSPPPSTCRSWRWRRPTRRPPRCRSTTLCGCRAGERSRGGSVGGGWVGGRGLTVGRRNAFVLLPAW